MSRSGGMSYYKEVQPVKVVIINTQYVQTDAMNFKSVVQSLTGKDSVIPDEMPRLSSKRRTMSSTVVVQGGGEGGGNNKMARRMSSFKRLDRGMASFKRLDREMSSFKDLDRLLMEFPSMDELYRLCVE